MIRKTYICLSIVFLFISLVFSQQLNIHFDLTPSIANTAKGIDEKCHQYDPSDDIWLNDYMKPHVTLYLAEFLDEYIADVVAAIRIALLGCSSSFTYATETHYASGSYLMWSTEKPEAMQVLSNCIVLATSQFRDPNAEMPQWILDLPDGDEKDRKESYFNQYGSPNVFDEFYPHITLAYDDNANNISFLEEQIPQPDILTGTGCDVVVGQVGPHGSVIKGQSLAQIHLDCY
ncbi:hypothetical protein ADUPG1_008256 [Aduncisulcus paluster]|uniref:Uncharacterized protein n=1 Tax=Aduncisulcus paluster TaxID=2918883 RepID=A0ABQ5KVF0_9EUKA|nr:hypothetical protein ADUPG1_008256 [Aduncisulcus paluster]